MRSIRARGRSGRDCALRTSQMLTPPCSTVDSLKVELDAEAGLVRAIDGLSLAIERGETFALVGESGCGKSMTALALMRLLPDNGAVIGGLGHARRAATCWRLPEREMRAVRGGRIGMIFQEPATSLNPVMTVGRPDRRGDRGAHRRCAAPRRASARRSNGCAASASPSPSAASTTTRSA